jgi:hypothetical protein
MHIAESIELLKTYDGPLGLTLRHGTSEELISQVERSFSVVLPADFKTLYRFTDGFETEEDIFNMIRLVEIMDNKTRYNKEPLYFAEYMIYSDMWQLEINPEDPDQYLISVVDYQHGRIVLTSSLGEFIARFLKGGVFEIGGLYAWADEIKAKLYGNTNPIKIKPLLWLFRECLKRGLKTKQDVIKWADWIIATEDEPHQFFIEMSTSHDVNDLITVLESVHLDEDILQVRALFGTIDTMLLINTININKVISILNEYRRDERLTQYERDEITALIVASDYLDDCMPNQKLKTQLREDIKTFFNNYSSFGQYYLLNREQLNADLVKKFGNMQSNKQMHLHSASFSYWSKFKSFVKNLVK